MCVCVCVCGEKNMRTDMDLLVLNTVHEDPVYTTLIVLTIIGEAVVCVVADHRDIACCIPVVFNELYISEIVRQFLL